MKKCAGNKRAEQSLVIREDEALHRGVGVTNGIRQGETTNVLKNLTESKMLLSLH
jgi:hypothetical protein